MKEQLHNFINNELIIVKSINGKLSITVGTLVRLRKNAIQIQSEVKVGVNEFSKVHEYVPYNSIEKISTGQKVLTR